VRRYLLDTSVPIGYFNGRRGAVALIDPWLENREAATSVLVYAEAVEDLKGQPNFIVCSTMLRQLLHRVYPYGLTYAVLDNYAEIRRSLRPPHGTGLSRWIGNSLKESYSLRAAATRLAIKAAVEPAPMPLSMLTTTSPGAQDWSIAISAAVPSPP
jgi:hypothetical protein